MYAKISDNCYVNGNYALTGVKNAFNPLTSWWLSKKGCSVAVYCFSTSVSGSALDREVRGHMDYRGIGYQNDLEALLGAVGNNFPAHRY